MTVSGSAASLERLLPQFFYFKTRRSRFEVLCAATLLLSEAPAFTAGVTGHGVPRLPS